MRFAPTVHGMVTTASSRRSRALRASGASPAIPETERTGGQRCIAPTPRVCRTGAPEAVSDYRAAGIRLHAVAEGGIPTRDIAEAIGRAFDLPVTSIDSDDIQDHFGWIGMFFGMEMSATSIGTREFLGWIPTGPTLIEDLDAGAYSALTPAAR